MRRWGIAPIAALVVALLVLALGGCGGSDSGSGGSTATSDGSTARTETSGAKANGGSPDEGAAKHGGGRNGGDSTGGEVQAAPLEVSGGGSTQYRVKGGDNSIQEFGEESDEDALGEAATALHDYLVARAEADWPAACASLAESVREQLQALASRSKGLEGKGCAAILEALTPPLPASARRESTIVDAGSLRVEGERAFLIYRGAEGATYAVLMVPEDGWKVGSLGATPLS